MKNDNGGKMCYECRMFDAGPSLCIVDRKVWKGYGHCPQCGQPGIAMGTKWRAPRQSDEAAWKRVESGDFLWEHSKGYIGKPTWVGDKLNLAKKKPEGLRAPYKDPFISWQERIRDEILRRMSV